MAGSSPRGRGTLPHAAELPRGTRFIPARAGNTQPRPWPSARGPVHPRAGGEHVIDTWDVGAGGGSSPRGRGTPAAQARCRDRVRFIPARAGNTGPPRTLRDACAVHPRAGGEHGLIAADVTAARGSSPRGRGTRQFLDDFHLFIRFIPARAGNTIRRVISPRSTAVHPRAGGEHLRAEKIDLGQGGSSPRGRGTRGYQ